MLPEKQSLDGLILDFPDSIPFIDFWKSYLNFGYYFLLVPFCLKRNPDYGKLEMHTNKFQRILCGTVQITILLQYLSLLWWSSRKMDSQNQMSYFTSLCYIGYTGYHLSLNLTFWLKQNAFRLVFDHMQKLNFYDQKKNLQKAIFLINAVAIFTSLTALVMGMTDSYLVSNLYTHEGWAYFYNDLKERSELLLFVPEEQSVLLKCLVSFLTVLQILILVPSVILVPYLDLFVLLVPLCVRRIMQEFSKFCKNSMGSPVAAERILKKYARVRKFIKNLNRAIGILICACVSVSLPYYAAWIGMYIFESNNVHPVTLLRVYAFFMIFFLALSLGADINKKGIEFYCWISSLENTDAVSSKTVASLLMDLHSNQIALKGCAFFVITFRFLGTIFGVIVTYSIITVQLQITRRAQYGCHKGEEPVECECPSNSTIKMPLL